MAIKIEAPDIERRIQDVAARQGLPAEAYLLHLVSTYLPQEEQTEAERRDGELPASPSADPRPFYATASADEWKRAMEEWSQSHSTATPLIPDEALRRENLYEDRGA